MINYNFNSCQLEDIKENILFYYKTNNILADAYWEEQIFSSNFYQIFINKNYAGFFSIQNENRLTLFHLFDSFKHFSQEIFFKVKKMEQVNEAFLPTGDEFFLSNCLDNFKTLNVVGYFTKDSKRTISIENDLILQLATIEDFSIIKSLSNNFFSKLITELSEGKIYIAKKDHSIVGFGHYVSGILLPHYLSIGMYVIKEYRGAGYGTKILSSLKNLAYSEKKQPIAGCYYFNHNSLKTQLKIGNYSSTRLLLITF